METVISGGATGDVGLVLYVFPEPHGSSLSERWAGWQHRFAAPCAGRATQRLPSSDEGLYLVGAWPITTQNATTSAESL